MKTFFRGVLAAWLLSSYALSVQAEGRIVVDSGRFIVFQNNLAVATENFEFTQAGDSLVVTAVVERKTRDSSGTEVRFQKTAQLAMAQADFGLITYTSKDTWKQHSTMKRVTVSDTTLDVTSEVDGAGDLVTLVRPPGKLFILDPLVFTMFDVICRGVSHQTFTQRPIQLITLGTTSTTTEATIATGGADTVTWGGKRVIARRFVMTDSGSRFTVWVDPNGHMLRLEHEGGGLAVIRQEPTPAPTRKKSATKK